MLDDILKALLGGENQGSSNQNDNPLFDLLQGFLGGQAAPSDASAETADSGFGMDDILASVLTGGSGSSTGGNPLLEPMVNLLSKELGLEPNVARQVVNAAVTLLIGWWQKRQEGVDNQPADALPDPMAGFDLGSLLGQNRLQSHEVTTRLAAETEMSEEEAANNIEAALRLFSTGLGGEQTDRGSE